MIRETELNLLIPSPELLVRLASQDKPFGISAGPPRIRFLRETYFDTPEQALRRRGMTCKLRQGQGEIPSVVVTVGEGPDSEGITSRSRLTAAAVGFGIFETLRGESEAAVQVRKFVDPKELRPQISLDIQRLGRLHRSGLLRRPTLYLYFDRISIQAGGGSSLIHEIRIRRHRAGGPLIRDLGQRLRDQYHLFPDGLTTLQRAHRILSMERKVPDSDLSPYALKLVLALIKEGRIGLVQRGDLLCIPTFRGSGEDAARALLSDLTGSPELELNRLGVTEPREGMPVVEVWVAPDSSGVRLQEGHHGNLVWYPWHALLELVGRGGLRDPNLLSGLLLLTRRRLLGQLACVPPYRSERDVPRESSPAQFLQAGEEGVGAELQAVDAVLPFLRTAENGSAALEIRLNAVRDFSSALRNVFSHQVRELKERVLSGDGSSQDPELVLLLDLLSLRIRGLVDRLYQALREDLLPQLEAREIFLRRWPGLMHEDRRALLAAFSEEYLPKLKIIADWGPAFVPEMPPGGCALGLTARSRGSAATRFFHAVLGEDTPSFLPVPNSGVFLPLEEVIRGFFFSRYPDLEKADTHLFRFRTAEVTVRKVFRLPIVTPAPGVENTAARTREETGSEFPGLALPEPLVKESKESVVIRVLTHQKMPETHQAQLLRALERQVARRTPLIGWSDLYPVDGPLDLSGLADLLVPRPPPSPPRQ